MTPITLAKRAAIPLMAMWALLSLGAGARNALLPLNSQDLGPLYKSSSLWWNRHDPYAFYTSAEWERASHLPAPPNLPLIVAYSTPYTPIALLNLAPLSVFQWDVAKRLWLIVNLFLAFFVPFLIRHLWYRNWSVSLTAFFVLFWLGGIGLRVGLGNGQHTLFWFACTVGALALYRFRRNLIAGALFAVAFHKVQLAAIFTSFIIAKKWWRLLSLTAVCGLLLLLLFLAHLDVPTSRIWSSYQAELQWWSRSMEGGGLKGLGNTHLYPALTAILGKGTLLPQILMYGMALSAFLAIARLASRDKAFPTDIEISSLMLFAMWAVYNSIYSTVVVILPIAALYERMKNGHVRGKLWLVLLSSECALTLIWFVDARKLGVCLRETMIYRGSLLPLPICVWTLGTA